MLLHFSHGTGNYGLTSRPNSGFLGGSVAEFDRSVESLLPCEDTIGTVPRVLPEKQSVIPGGYHQNIWRDQFLRLAQG